MSPQWKNSLRVGDIIECRDTADPFSDQALPRLWRRYKITQVLDSSNGEKACYLYLTQIDGNISMSVHKTSNDIAPQGTHTN